MNIDLEQRIDPADEMYRYHLRLAHDDDRAARSLYFDKGRQIAAAIEAVANWSHGGLRRVERLLDFGCGYGRSTRFLTQRKPPSRITATLGTVPGEFREERGNRAL